MPDWLFITILVILAFAIGGAPIAKLIEDHIIHRDGGHTRRHREFHDAGRLEGKGYLERADDLFLRETLACLRREASDAVRSDPTLWFEHIEKAKARAFQTVAGRDKALIHAFAGMIGSLSYGHILYPTEARMVDKSLGVGWNCRPDQDQIAALKIVRPGRCQEK